VRIHVLDRWGVVQASTAQASLLLQGNCNATSSSSHEEEIVCVCVCVCVSMLLCKWFATILPKAYSCSLVNPPPREPSTMWTHHHALQWYDDEVVRTLALVAADKVESGPVSNAMVRRCSEVVRWCSGWGHDDETCGVWCCSDSVFDLGMQWDMYRVGQSRMHTPYMTVHMLNLLLKTPCLHMCLWFWLTIDMSRLHHRKVHVWGSRTVKVYTLYVHRCIDKFSPYPYSYDHMWILAGVYIRRTYTYLYGLNEWSRAFFHWPSRPQNSLKLRFYRVYKCAHILGQLPRYRT